MDRCRGTLPDPGVDDFGDHLYRYLEEHIQNKVRERGEFQLTSALDRLRREQGFLGLLVDGVR